MVAGFNTILTIVGSELLFWSILYAPVKCKQRASDNTEIRGLGKAGSEGLAGLQNLELMSEICIWRLCRTSVKVMAMIACLTVIHQKPRACIHIQR